jgi:hypothetical protein
MSFVVNEEHWFEAREDLRDQILERGKAPHFTSHLPHETVN